MKTKFLLSTLFASFWLISNLNAQTPTLEWAKNMGGIGYDEAYSISTDTIGNVYDTGTFEGTVDFDPGAGTKNITSTAPTDIFILKLDANGNFQWVKYMGGGEFNNSYSVVTDIGGNVYTVGVFSETADFDPGAGTMNLTSNGLSDIFIQKLDTGGDLLWVKQMGGIGYDQGRTITIDNAGNVYTIGSFRNTVDFDPGDGTTNFTATGVMDVFIQKLDAAGNLLWVKQLGGSSYVAGLCITTDINGSVYTTGYFEETADFDPGTGTTNLTSHGNSDIFIQKLDAAGNFLWVKQMGGDDYDYGTSITSDSNSNVYTTGTFVGTVDFDPGATTLNLASNTYIDIFIQKLDAAGNLIWAKQIDGTGYDQALSIIIDAKDNLYTMGSFQGTADFDPFAGTTYLTSNGYFDAFVLKLSLNTTVGISENTFT